MKALFKVLGILLLICGIGLYFVAGKAQENAKGFQTHIGYMQGDKFHQTDTVTIGGNPKAYEGAETLKNLGLVFGIGGAVVLLLSLITKGE